VGTGGLIELQGLPIRVAGVHCRRSVGLLASRAYRFAEVADGRGGVSPQQPGTPQVGVQLPKALLHAVDPSGPEAGPQSLREPNGPVEVVHRRIELFRSSGEAELSGCGGRPLQEKSGAIWRLRRWLHGAERVPSRGFKLRRTWTKET
jgi:hypothetical protein